MFRKIGKSNVIQEVWCDFMDGYHFVDFERPWFVEMIEIDRAPVDWQVHQTIDQLIGSNAIIALWPLMVVRCWLGVVV